MIHSVSSWNKSVVEVEEEEEEVVVVVAEVRTWWAQERGNKEARVAVDKSAGVPDHYSHKSLRD